MDFAIVPASNYWNIWNCSQQWLFALFDECLHGHYLWVRKSWGHWSLAGYSGETMSFWRLMSLTNCKAASYVCTFSPRAGLLFCFRKQTLFLCDSSYICRYIILSAKLDSMTIQNTSQGGYQSPLFLCPRFLWWIIKKNWTDYTLKMP